MANASRGDEHHVERNRNELSDALVRRVVARRQATGPLVRRGGSHTDSSLRHDLRTRLLWFGLVINTTGAPNESRIVIGCNSSLASVTCLQQLRRSMAAIH